MLHLMRNACLLQCVVLIQVAGSSLVSADGGHGYLTPIDPYRESDLSASRSGIIDLFRMPSLVTEDPSMVNGNAESTGSGQQIGLCHIAFFNFFSIILPGIGRVPFELVDLVVGGFAAAHLALQMLNTGDGSVVEEIEGLPSRCPIRFTIEAFDTGASTAVAAHSFQDVMQRTTPQEREVCALLGSEGSRSTIPLGILSALEGRPHMSPMASAIQLDDRQTFPLSGRLVNSDLGQLFSLVLYWKEKQVSHVGIVHWNDDHGNAVIRAINEIAAQHHPELTVVAVDIPAIGATPEDYAKAIKILARTKFRWFYASVSADDCMGLIEQAVENGMAGTGKHVWMFLGSILAPFPGMQVEKDSLLAQGMPGVGFFTQKMGRPGMPVFDKFEQAFTKLDNPEDLALLDSRMVRYPDEPDFPRAVASSSALATDPTFFASTVFDSVIMLGLSACKAAATTTTDSQGIHVDGTTMFSHILDTSFTGATGNVTVDPKTGTRLPETGLYIMVNLLSRELNETHVTFDAEDSWVYLDGQWTEEIPYIYNDGTINIPVDLPELEPDIVFIGQKLRIMGIILASLVLATSLAFAGWTIAKRDVFIVRASQPIFLLLLCLGTFIMGATIIPLSIDDEIASTETCDMVCMAAPWFASVGFALIFAALFSKTWRVNRLLLTPNIQRLQLSAFDVMAPLFVILIANFALLGAWTAIHPLRWEREESVFDSFNRVVESRGHCTSDGYLPFVISLAVIDVGALFLASYQSYQSRGVATEFAESEHIAKSIMIMLLVSSVGVPTMILVSDDAKANYFAMTSIIFVFCSAVLLCIFVPKIKGSTKGSTDAKQAVRRTSAYMSKTFDTREQAFESDSSDNVSGIRILQSPLMLEKYRAENEDLREEVTELKQRIAAMTGSSQNNTTSGEKPSEEAWRNTNDSTASPGHSDLPHND